MAEEGSVRVDLSVVDGFLGFYESNICSKLLFLQIKNGIHYLPFKAFHLLFREFLSPNLLLYHICLRANCDIFSYNTEAELMRKVS